MRPPIRLPQFVKRPFRTIRDSPLANRLITGAAKACLPDGRWRDAAKWRAPRIGSASARLPDGQILRMHCNQQESILNAIFYDGWVGDEPETLPIWRSLCEQAGTVIDIGAHVGHFTLVAALSSPNAEIHAFEPFAPVAGLLKNNLALNGLAARVRVHEVALGQKDGMASFFTVPTGIPSSSSLSEDFVQSGNPQLVEHKVRLARLDHELDRLRDPVIVKIDTECTEPDVLAGATAMLRRHQPIMIIEVLPGFGVEQGLAEQLRAAHYEYRCFHLTHAGPRGRAAIVGDAAARNYLFVPRHGPAAETLGPLLDRLLEGAGENGAAGED